MLKTAPDDDAPRIIFPGQLIGSVTVCALLGIDRSTLVRRIQRGDIVPLAQLDGATGAYVFDRFDFPAEAAR
ncbi:hypothetical protein SAMN04515691_2999 [Leifsonia sp. 98AMF]|uniref:hypothetical protein n=1 Tax=unclassified Leifsonia TaxID=2663824 RepID=UPI00087D1A76|nr:MULTISPECIES: hypothetical protein [unclassified Leifsonia]SDH15782.1 hypothetical protein SAMN04515690_1017 [Leifsonia sp. 197AMF]SDJ22425.1 hypothetical protein SAMN04515684_2765 [Leifsonia sp. 466MF]SDK61259.1 hypothetical protein SAMN04515683_3999 [Leifsonia sp. 157MF]SDN44113.1 hypothetical protein SAMN04515686_0949 [Leifsonia sp. 509MF]SEN66934.1 hypothetical protein SAMN04515685_3980 [Leifsonia sp. 467MF]